MFCVLTGLLMFLILKEVGIFSPSLSLVTSCDSGHRPTYVIFPDQIQPTLNRRCVQEHFQRGLKRKVHPEWKFTYYLLTFVFCGLRNFTWLFISVKVNKWWQNFHFLVNCSLNNVAGSFVQTRYFHTSVPSYLWKYTSWSKKVFIQFIPQLVAHSLYLYLPELPCVFINPPQKWSCSSSNDERHVIIHFSLTAVSEFKSTVTNTNVFLSLTHFALCKVILFGFCCPLLFHCVNESCQIYNNLKMLIEITSLMWGCMRHLLWTVLTAVCL